MNAQGTGYTNREAASRSGEEIGFSFGKNWLAYVSGIEERNIIEAQRSFTEFTGFTNLAGSTFLDAGCGSGMSSLVALRLNAEKVVSFDIDPNSVACTRELRSRFATNCASWEVLTESLLAPDLHSKVPPSDLVCCWGVAHHTGSMWEAIDNVAGCVAEDGRLVLAIYNRTKHSGTWLTIKRIYNWAPAPVKRLLLLGFHAKTFASLMLHGQNPRRFLQQYVKNRGMSYFRDVEDWLGGLPYEYASVDEVSSFLAPKGFDLIRVNHAASHGCNEFVFQKLSVLGRR